MDDVDKEFDDQFGKGEKKKAPPIVKDVCIELMTKYRFLTIEETGEIWYYKEGVYVPGGQILIEKEAEKIYGYQMNTANLAQIIGHIMRRTYHKHEELDADINMINVKNGLYDVDNDLLREHTPEYLSINQKNIIYDKDAKPKRFVKFLQEVLYPRDIRTAIEAMAYTFHRDYIVEIIILLYGLGANGKTVYTSVLSALHGPENVSNVPLTEMLGDRFALSDLENRDLNIDNELAGETIKETAVLKRLTGGSRQHIRIQRKNQRAYDTTLYAKLFFNANRIPNSQDLSDAYNRRVVILSFPNRFDGEAADTQLISKLTTQEEISGIFNILMKGLRTIRRTKNLYVNEKTIEEKRVKYERAINPIKAFLTEAISEESTEASYVPKTHLYGVYIQYCNEFSLPVEKYLNFSKILKNEFDFQDTRVKPEKSPLEIEEVGVENGNGNGNSKKKDDRIPVWRHTALIEKYAQKSDQTTLL